MRKAFSAESSLFIKATHTRSSLAIPFHYISTVCIWNEINKKFWHDIDSDDDVDGEVEQQLLSWVEVEQQLHHAAGAGGDDNGNKHGVNQQLCPQQDEVMWPLHYAADMSDVNTNEQEVEQLLLLPEVKQQLL